MSEPRFYIDHGMIHDRVTGKHVSTETIEINEGVFDDTPTAETCALLNELAPAHSDGLLREALEPWLRHSLDCMAQRDLHNDAACRCGLDTALQTTGIDALRKALVEHNDALRSAASVIARKGDGTNWPGIHNAVQTVLIAHHKTTSKARAALAGQQAHE